MNHAIVPFSKKNIGEVRTTLINGAPYFALADVCRILGVRHPPTVATRLREEDDAAAADQAKPQDVGVVSNNTLQDGIIRVEVVTSGGVRGITFISEANLYSVIFMSRKAAALRFKRWVVYEVLPAIRKTGSYIGTTPKTYLEALTAHHEVLGKLILEVARREQLEVEQVQLKALNAELVPKAEFFDTVANSKKGLDVGQVARILDTPLGRNGLFRFLRDHGAFMRDNRAHQKYIKAGYFCSIEQSWTDPSGEVRISVKTLVLQRGVEFIRRLLAKHEIRPVPRTRALVVVRQGVKRLTAGRAQDSLLDSIS